MILTTLEEEETAASVKEMEDMTPSIISASAEEQDLLLSILNMPSIDFDFDPWPLETLTTSCSRPQHPLDMSSAQENIHSISVSSPTAADDISIDNPLDTNKRHLQNHHHRHRRHQQQRSSGSRNLAAERRRRLKLNEKLFALRAVVPKITKMDKASIMGDAVGYVKDLQNQIEAMQIDILTLWSTLNPKTESFPIHANDNELVMSLLSWANLPRQKVLQLDVLKMEDHTYHMKINCHKGQGVLIKLSRVLDYLDFDLINASIASVHDSILSNIVFKVVSESTIESNIVRKMVMNVLPMFGFSLEKSKFC